jgi:hypothetical protein
MLCCWHKDLISKCASLLVPHPLDLVKFALHVRDSLIFTANIIADHLVQLVDIEIDEISLGYLCTKKSKYYPCKQARIENRLPDYLENIVCFGYNGRYELSFQVPTYIWFLENL